MEYIDTNGDKWNLGRDRELVTYAHEDYDGPEDKRAGVAVSMDRALDDMENMAEEARERRQDFLAEESLPAWFEKAPLSAQIAYIVAGNDPEMFDQIKANLKGE